MFLNVRQQSRQCYKGLLYDIVHNEHCKGLYVFMYVTQMLTNYLFCITMRVLFIFSSCLYFVKENNVLCKLIGTYCVCMTLHICNRILVGRILFILKISNCFCIFETHSNLASSHRHFERNVLQMLCSFLNQLKVFGPLNF